MSKKLKKRIVVVDRDPNQDDYAVWEKDVSLILLRVGLGYGWVWVEKKPIGKCISYRILTEAKYNKKYPGLELKRGTYRRVLITTLPGGRKKAEFADDWEYYHG